MSLAIIATLYIRKSLGQVQSLVTGLTNIAGSPAPDFVAIDNLTIQIYFCDDTGVVYAPLVGSAIGNGDAVIFDGKPLSDPTSPEALFLTDNFVQMQDGNGNYYYQADCDFTNPALAAAIAATGNDVLQVLCGVQVQNAGNTERITYIFDANVWATPYTGTEGMPATAGVYPAPGLLARIDQFGDLLCGANARLAPLANGMEAQVLPAGADPTVAANWVTAAQWYAGPAAIPLVINAAYPPPGSLVLMDAFGNVLIGQNGRLCPLGTGLQVQMLPAGADPTVQGNWVNGPAFTTP